MTLSLKIRHNGPACYGFKVERGGERLATVIPGEEVEVTLWDGAPLTVVEFPYAPAEPAAKE